MSLFFAACNPSPSILPEGFALVVSDGANNHMRALKAIPRKSYEGFVVLMQRDVSKDGKPPAAEEWLRGLQADLGPDLPTWYPPPGVHDLNDYIRSTQSPAVLLCNVLVAARPFVPRGLTALPPMNGDAAASGRSETSEPGVTEPPPFPVDCLPPALSQWVGEVAARVHVDPALPACVALGVVSTALGKWPRANFIDQFVSSPNMFVVGIAPSAEGKSETLRLGLRAVRRVEDELLNVWFRETRPRLMGRLQELEVRRAALTQSRNTGGPSGTIDRAKALEELAVAEAELRRQLELEPRLTTENVTPEKLALLLANGTGTMSLNSAEPGDALRAALGGYNKSGEAADSLFLKAWSQESCWFDRISRPSVNLPEPCLSMILLLQPCRFDKLVGGKFALDGGLLPRLLLARIPDSMLPCSVGTRPSDEGVLQRFDELVECLLRKFRLAGATCQLPVESDAREVIAAFRQECVASAREVSAELRPFKKRHAEHACRLALVLHCAKHGADSTEVPITRELMAQAIGLVRWFDAHQQYALRSHFDTIVAQDESVVLDFFRRRPTGMFSRSELTRARILPAYGKLIDRLVDGGVLRSQTTQTGGRPSSEYGLATFIL